jgi:hypothetical protein
MKPRTMIVIALVAILLLASGAIALAKTIQEGDPISYQVETSLSTGQGYQLTHQAEQVSGTLSGGGYTLLIPASSISAGSGCCCTYLPCLMKK